MSDPLIVISQNPPGGRCTLYALYAAELESCLGLGKRITFSEQRDAHGNGFPSLVLKGKALQPSDGVILSPQDVVLGLVGAGIDLSGATDLTARLDAVQEKFMEQM